MFSKFRRRELLKKGVIKNKNVKIIKDQGLIQIFLKE